MADFFLSNIKETYTSIVLPQPTTATLVTKLFGEKMFYLIRKYPVFGRFERSKWIRSSTHYLKSTIKLYCINISRYFGGKHGKVGIFFVAVQQFWNTNAIKMEI